MYRTWGLCAAAVKGREWEKNALFWDAEGLFRLGNYSSSGEVVRGNVIFYGLDPDPSHLDYQGLNCIHYASRRRQPTNFLTEKSDPVAISLSWNLYIYNILYTYIILYNIFFFSIFHYFFHLAFLGSIIGWFFPPSKS